MNNINGFDLGKSTTYATIAVGMYSKKNIIVIIMIYVTRNALGVNPIDFAKLNMFSSFLS